MKKHIINLVLVCVCIVGMCTLFCSYDLSEVLSTTYKNIHTDVSSTTDRLVYNKEKHLSMDITLKIVGGIFLFLGGKGLIYAYSGYAKNAKTS